MSERRRSAVALSSRAHAFSVEALIGSNKKRKLRDWEEKGLDLSMEALSPAGPLADTEDAGTHSLEPHPGECVGSDYREAVRKGTPNGVHGCGGRPGRRRPALLLYGFLFLGANVLRLPKFAGTNLGSWPELCILVANKKQEGLLASTPFFSGSREQLLGAHVQGLQAPMLRSAVVLGNSKSQEELGLVSESSGRLALLSQDPIFPSWEMPSLSHLASDRRASPSLNCLFHVGV
jgi:hypothetical protein